MRLYVSRPYVWTEHHILESPLSRPLSAHISPLGRTSFFIRLCVVCLKARATSVICYMKATYFPPLPLNFNEVEHRWHNQETSTSFSIPRKSRGYTSKQRRRLVIMKAVRYVLPRFLHHWSTRINVQRRVQHAAYGTCSVVQRRLKLIFHSERKLGSLLTLHSPRLSQETSRLMESCPSSRWNGTTQAIAAQRKASVDSRQLSG